MLSWLIYPPHATNAYSILLTTIKEKQPLNIYYLDPVSSRVVTDKISDCNDVLRYDVFVDKCIAVSKQDIQ